MREYSSVVNSIELAPTTQVSAKVPGWANEEPGKQCLESEVLVYVNLLQHGVSRREVEFVRRNLEAGFCS